MRRPLVAVMLAAAAMIVSRGLLIAHAMLLSSDPKAGSVLTKSPVQVRLVFSEAIDAAVSGIRIVPSRGAPTDLAVSIDPRNKSALVALLVPLSPGAYRVVWRTVSVDGHATNGAFGFTVRGDSAKAPTIALPVAPPILQPDTLPSSSPSGVPVTAALLRGLAIGCLMSLAGILFFSRMATAPSPQATRVSRWFAFATVILLAAHLMAWMSSAAVGHGFDLSWGRSMLGTTSGQMELARLAAAAVALGALLARRMSLALVFSALALVVSGTIGHPAAMHSLWTIPAKAVHLCAGAAWLGGLLWLILADRADPEKFIGEARLVSSVALASVILVVFSGTIQARFFVATWADLIQTSYGILVLLKIAGALILIAFGAHHRYRHLPNLATDTATRLRSSVRYEIGVFALVTLLGGLLAYTPPRG